MYLGASSYMINEATCSNLTRGPFLPRTCRIVDCCSRFTDSGSLKVERAVFPSFKRFAAISDKEIAIAIFPDFFISASIKFTRNVFPVPLKKSFLDAVKI